MCFQVRVPYQHTDMNNKGKNIYEWTKMNMLSAGNGSTFMYSQPNIVNNNAIQSVPPPNTVNNNAIQGPPLINPQFLEQFYSTTNIYIL